MENNSKTNPSKQQDNLTPKGFINKRDNSFQLPVRVPRQSTTTVDPVKPHRRHPRSVFNDRVKVKVYQDNAVLQKEGSSPDLSGGSGGSELVVSSHHDFREHRRRELSLQSSIMVHSSGSSSSSSFSGNNSMDESLHRYRDDFDDMRCKIKIFGESLNLCNCIASDFKGRLTYMERRLKGLERRQKHAGNESNYSRIIQKNKQLSAKTKDYVQKLQKCGTEQEMREVAGKIVKNYLHGLWKVVEPEDLQFRRISGGLSNFIYVIGLPADLTPLYARLDSQEDVDDETKAIRQLGEGLDEPKQVLLRIYGQVHGERAMDAIVTESVIFTLLSERRLGPKLFGVFSGGRIEEFIPARALLTRELADPALSMKIAEKMAAIHSMEIPLSKEPTFIWKTMAKWLKTVKDECFNNGVKGKNEAEEKAIKRLREINYDHEIEWLKKYLATIDSPVVFCHNDLQEGNILLLEDIPQPTQDEFEPTTFIQKYDVPGDSDGVEKEPSITSTENLDLVGEASRAAFLTTTETTHAARASFMDANFEEGNTSDTILSHISDSGEPKIFLIDFEYCAYNFRAFDIANHFQEWAYDYTNTEHPFFYENHDHWPTLEQKPRALRGPYPTGQIRAERARAIACLPLAERKRSSSRNT
ncbi:uncharacterized protein LOC126379153 isoform X2 [Pectinophora gossypiella]|uniref:uncharacterized protein LOC126379153 isoform X2 n=1 Tax=Pectinophora gossypiella TaxID=13191 RepID=UPI00214EF8C4|nr:uncharacterized protein LOC126379153 isoform X2 [Pectinophora gossypiella]